MANTENCPKVGIVMGSDSDMPVMAKAADILEEAKDAKLQEIGYKAYLEGMKK